MIGEISLDAAFANANANRGGFRWAPQRLAPAYDPILRPRFSLSPGSTIFTIGSCFARNIEEHLQRLDFQVPMLSFSVPPHEYGGRPAGILNKYTPLNALQEIERTLRILKEPERIDEIIAEPLFPLANGTVIDLELRGYVPVSQERAIQRRREIFEVFRHAFSADCIVLTLGLIECWFDSETGRAIQETPNSLALRRLKSRFTLRILNVVEVLDALDRTMRLLLSYGSVKKILLTVSPVPLEATFSGQDVVIANAYSKATLRTASQDIANRFPEVDYFPSYEIATMSRGENVWESDLIHVTDQCVGGIVDVLIREYMQAPSVDVPDEMAVLNGPFDRQGPLGWSAPLPEALTHLTDTPDAARHSPLLLFEDASELGPPHELHQTIMNNGGGSFCFWKDTLYFSTSDGSDPNSNSRSYSIRRAK